MAYIKYLYDLGHRLKRNISGWYMKIPRSVKQFKFSSVFPDSFAAMNIKTTLLLSFWTISQLVLANGEEGYYIERSKGEIIIDGDLQDAGWSNVLRAGDFHQYFPADTIPAESQVEFMLTYDDDYLYFAAKLYNLTDDRKYVVPSLRRDYRGTVDGVTLIIDPFQDNTNAFQFGINPYGVQREALVSNGGQNGGRDLELSWDNKWVAQAKQYKGYWIAEAAIPFKTLRYKKGSKKWNINVYRIDTETGERSTWAPIPRQYQILTLAFLKELVFDEPLKQPGPNISLIPYVTGSGTQDFEENQTNPNTTGAIGFDAKVAVTPGLNLDVTVNPDFSQVELDEQVTNLDRFELFFPERRQFFLENNDLFTSSGHPFLSRPFFSRRIGIARDTSTGVNLQNKIDYGVRLSGKINKNWRMSALNMQEAKIESINKPTTHYTAAVLQRKMFARSSLSGIYVSKDPVASSLENFTGELPKPNRVVGLDYILSSSDAKWYGKFFFHKSFDDNPQPDEYSHLAFISYNSNTWNFSWANVYVGENYDAQVGFVPRPGIFRINPDLGYTFFSKGGFFNRHEVKGEAEVIWRDERVADKQYSMNYEARLSNTGFMEASISQRYTYLFDSFDPTNSDGELAAGTDYVYYGLNFFYRGDWRKPFAYSFGGYVGEFLNGFRYNLRTSFNLRLQPLASIRMNINYNRLQMPKPLKNTNLWLIGPRIDFTLSKSVFLTSFIQYNSQIDNININTRFQWRFKPVSDLFIVYTDNYGTNDFSDLGLQKKNRALILKLTYWFNL